MTFLYKYGWTFASLIGDGMARELNAYQVRGIPASYYSLSKFGL